MEPRSEHMPDRRVQPAITRPAVVVALAVALFGVGTAPAVAVDESPPYVVTGGNSPALRLSQDTSSGFPAQQWDVVGNEQRFFVRDPLHANRIPFRIGVGAPTNSLLVEPNGNVGIGAKVTSDTPPAVVPAPSPLSVFRADGTAKIVVEEGSGTRAPRVLGELVNNGPAQLRFTDAGADPMSWFVGGGDGHEFVLRAASPAASTLTVSATGDTRSAGALEQRTDGLADVAALDPQTMLARIRKLPGFSTWRYAADPEQTPHVGPSSDVRTSLGVGPGGNVLPATDLAVAALAGVRALADIPPGSDPRVTPLVTDVAALKTRSTTYLQRIRALESTTKKLTSANKKLTSSNKKMAKTLSSLQKQVRSLARRR